MSLHTLANHMSAHGRGPDTTLVHMSPREVHGLQALAMAHGGSLTINPHTGLPEAGFLENLLPAIAGFALNAFAPGIGGAVGSALGLGEGLASTVGTGLLVGGATGLASGSLEKGLMAGLGAYGGAGLGSSLVGAGSPSVGMDAASGARDAGMSAAAQASPAATAARLQAGAGAAMGAPGDFMKSNLMNLGFATAPAILGASQEEEETSAPKRQSGNRYMYRDDPITGRSYAYKTYSGDEVKNSPPMVFGNASGGLMQHYDAGGPVSFGNVGAPVDANGNPILPSTKDTRSDSERAQDYLMGKGPNPFLFYHKDAGTTLPVDPIKKAAEATSSLQEEIAKGPTESRGLSQEQRDEKNDPNSWANQSPEAKAQYYAANPGMASFVRFGQDVVGLTPLGQLQQKTMPGFYEREKALTYGLSPSSGLSYVTPPASTTGTPFTPSSPAVQHNIANTDFSGMDRGSTLNAQAERAEQDARIAAFDASREGSRGGGGYGGDAGGGSRDAGPATGDRGYGSQGQHAAYGGLLDSRYADGGGITALAEGGYNLGSYSDGGRLLRGPGDGVSDDIPATIGQNQPARLADGEFVVPARIVSELGNGSTEAGARKLYAMMDRVQKSRSKTVGKDKVAANSRADKYLPA